MFSNLHCSSNGPLNSFSKDDISKEALKALYGTLKNDEDTDGGEKKMLPLFADITKYVYNKSESCAKGTLKGFNVGSYMLSYPAPIYKEVSVCSMLCEIILS